MIRDGCFKMDLSLLQALERKRVLDVLRRDKQLRAIEEDRIRRMKCELQELRRRGAMKSFARQYGERTCARCQRPLGTFCWDSGEVCRGCSHRVCSRCRVPGAGAADWRCTICHAYREVKIRSGEWFMEQRARKFPIPTDKYEAAGEKLLKTCNMLSHISIVPPTPPPHLDYPFLSRSGDFIAKPFTKSVEDLMVSVTSHIKKISGSQNDLLGVDNSRRASSYVLYSTQKSLSDTDINKSSCLYKGTSLSSLFRRNRDSDQDGSSTGAEEETSYGSDYSGGNGGSASSISTDCGLFEGVAVAGELELALAFNASASCLEITVGGCRNLSYGDSRKKKCQPYVKLYVLPEKGAKMKTAVKKNTTDPVFDEVLKYHTARHLLTGKRLQASVWHSGTLRRKTFLGEVLIPLDSVTFEDEAAQCPNWYPLCPKAEGPDGGAME